ncbi:sensor histidine kinase [Streptomyces qinglanensis]|uniref:histidine kinase n=1 Tax=Streptomyces qinglanensis TaxID=943816 RepID=A0A1H9NVX3_9ACTN|nr:sensor histidine kinase [Streptomyces qinglanensis]SER40194.1 Signal transduction histidine kinase [Streptomyces qinglanensis]
MTPGPGLSALWGQLRSLAVALATPAASREPLLGHAASRTVRLLPYVLASGFAIVLLPVTTQVLSHDFAVPGGWAGALSVAQTAPLILAVTRPLTAWWIVFGADLVGALVLLMTSEGAGRPWPWPPMVIVGCLVLYLALALRESRRTLLAVWLVTVSASLALGFAAPERSEGTNVLLIVLTGAVLLLGASLRERAEAQRRLAEQEHISEAERAQRTLLEERARIARELHDVVAHHMSVITVQADSAPYRIAEMPQEAREEFGSIAAAARESLAEMRRLLGVLRSESARGERAPQPGLERLEQLVEATVRAGVPTELNLSLPGAEDGGGRGDEAATGTSAGAAGADSAVAPTVTLSAYRIVQEALANVVRHAPGARTRVSVSVADGGLLSVLVVNGASPEPEAAPLETAGTGHGLVGMRERVRLVGGSLQVGALPDGGFRVAARLPLHPSPAAPPGRHDEASPEADARDAEQDRTSEHAPHPRHTGSTPTV